MQEFDTKGHRFAATVPEGWQAKAGKETVSFHAPQGALRFFASSSENPGMSAGDMAEGTAKSSDISGISTVEQSASPPASEGAARASWTP